VLCSERQVGFCAQYRHRPGEVEIVGPLGVAHALGEHVRGRESGDKSEQRISILVQIRIGRILVADIDIVSAVGRAQIDVEPQEVVGLDLQRRGVVVLLDFLERREPVRIDLWENGGRAVVS
jgi:hypothetical protein